MSCLQSLPWYLWESSFLFIELSRQDFLFISHYSTRRCGCAALWDGLGQLRANHMLSNCSDEGKGEQEAQNVASCIQFSAQLCPQVQRLYQTVIHNNVTWFDGPDRTADPHRTSFKTLSKKRRNVGTVTGSSCRKVRWLFRLVLLGSVVETWLQQWLSGLKQQFPLSS